MIISLRLGKAYRMTAALRRPCPFIPFEIMKRLYKAFILPHFEYCAPFLLGIVKGQTKRMEDADFYIMGTLFNLAK